MTNTISDIFAIVCTYTEDNANVTYDLKQLIRLNS